MDIKSAIITLGALMLLAACSSSPGRKPQTSMPAASKSVAPSGSEAKVAPGGSASVPANDEGTVTQQIQTLLGDADQYKKVFTELQKAVAANDKAAVATLVDYPLTVSVGGQRVIADADQFVEQYDRIITPSIAATITGQKLADVLVNSQGVMFGNGEVWLSGICKNEACSQQVVKVSRIQEVQGAVKFPLTVKVSLSDAAAQRVKHDGETVMIDVSYFGFATAATKDKADNILDCNSYEADLVAATDSPIGLNCKLLRGT